MRTLLIALFSLALTGCAWLHPEPQIVIQEVKVPVPVKCDKPQVDKPVRYFDQAKKENTLFDNTKYLAAENEELWGYTTKLEAAIDGCSK